MLLLTAANTYSGTTTVNDGTLNVSGTLRGSSAFNVGRGAKMELGGENMFVGGHGIAVGASRVIAVDQGTLLMNGDFVSRFGNVTLKNGATWTSNRGLGGWDALWANISGDVAATVKVENTGANTLASIMDGTGGIHLQGVQNFDVADVTGTADADLTVSMILGAQGDTGGAAGGINKTGAGTMVLAKANTYTGNTTINNGVLELTSAGKLYNGVWNNTAVLTVNEGGTWRLPDYSYDGIGKHADFAARRVLNGGTIEVTGESHTSQQAFMVNASGGTFRYVPTNHDQTLTLNKGNDTGIKVNGSLTFDAIGNMVIGSPVEGAGSLTKVGAGTLTLSAANTYSNGTTVSSGTLVVANASAVGTGAVTLSGGTLDLGAFRPVNKLAAGATGTFTAQLPGVLATNILMAVEAGVTQVPAGLTVQAYDASRTIRRGVPAVIDGNLVFIALTVNQVTSTEVEAYILAQVPAGMAGDLVQVVATDLRSNTVRSPADSANVAYLLNIVPVYTTDGTTISATFGYRFGPISIAMDSTMDVGIKVAVHPGTLGSAVTGSVKLMGSEKLGIEANFTEMSQKVNPFYGSEGAIDFVTVEPSTNRFFKIIVE